MSTDDLSGRLAAEAFSDVCPGARVDPSALSLLAEIIDGERSLLDQTALRLAVHCGRAAVDAEMLRLAAHLHALIAPPPPAHTAAYARAQNARAVVWPPPLPPVAAVGEGSAKAPAPAAAPAARPSSIPAAAGASSSSSALGSAAAAGGGALAPTAQALAGALVSGLKRARPHALSATFSSE